jgi:hypothetical protein
VHAEFKFCVEIPAWFTATAVLASCREEFSFVVISVNCKMDNPNNQIKDSVGETREF